MKPHHAVAVLAFCLVGNLLAGEPAIMIKQKAKDISNQNNERQGLPPQYPATPPPGSAAPAATPSAPVAPAAPSLTSEQHSLLKLNTDMAAIRGEVKKEQVEALAASLKANARGAVKPSAKSMERLAADLAAALTGRTLTQAQRGRIAQDIVAVLNNTTMPATQLNDVMLDVPKVLMKAGADEESANTVGADLKVIAAEVRKK